MGSDRPPPQGSDDAGRTHKVRVTDQKFLEDLLQRTLLTPGPAGEATAADLDALREVERRHRGEPFSLEPICVEMAEAILRSYFNPSGKSEEPWRLLSPQIARSLYQNPAAQERLRAVWQQLAVEAR